MCVIPRVETFFGIWLRICRKFIYKMVMHGSITADRYWNGARHKIYIYFFHVYILNIYFWGCFSFIFSICHFLFLHINIHTFFITIYIFICYVKAYSTQSI